MSVRSKDSRTNSVNDDSNETLSSMGSQESHVIRVYANNVLPELEYVSLLISESMTVREALDSILEKYRFRDKDDNLFYLAVQLTDNNPAQEGLTKKTLILDNRTHIIEYISCQQWFDTRFILRMKPGTVIRIFISILMEEQHFLDLMLSETICCNKTILMILKYFGKSKYLKKYTLYEEVLDTKYMRKLDGDEKLVEIFHNWKIKCDKSVFFRLHLNPERNK